jgi:hypothetical protein
MLWSKTRLRLTCLVILGLGSAAWLLSGDAAWAQSSERTPAETVAFRFPDITRGWQPLPVPVSVPQRPDATRTAAAKSAFALASADARVTLPTPSTGIPSAALGYAAPATEADRAPRGPAAAAHPRAAATPRPERRAALAPEPRSLNVFTDAKIADLKAKLKLSPAQQLYWPAVASALRGIEYRSHPSASTAIDPDSPGVQQLKSAAFPLILSFDEEQKDQVRRLARNMGLESVASSF